MKWIGTKQLFLKLENLFFPSICQGCGKLGTYLCDSCVSNKIQLCQVQQCHVCKTPVSQVYDDVRGQLIHKHCRKKTYLDGVFVVAEYSKFVEDYLGDIKYEFYFAMIEDLVALMISSLEKNSIFQYIVRKSTITYVPLHPMRQRWRGFNQAERIAEKIARQWGISCMRLLKRCRRTRSQVGLSRRERLENLKDAFVYVGDEHVTYKSIIIVDDVMTSGGTLEECAQKLKEQGVEKVYGLVVTRG